MAKLGRYSADRKKIEAISSTAGKTITVADCGTVFTVSETCSLTLPTCSAAGKGWWIKAVLLDASKTLTINFNSQTVVGIEVSNTCVAFTANQTITGTAGAQIEIISDGTRYMCVAHAVAAGNVQDA